MSFALASISSSVCVSLDKVAKLSASQRSQVSPGSEGEAELVCDGPYVCARGDLDTEHFSPFQSSSVRLCTVICTGCNCTGWSFRASL